MGQRVVRSSELNLNGGGEGKPSLNRALSFCEQTRNRAIYPWPG